MELRSPGPLTSLARQFGLYTWADALAYTRQLPYGRNASRTDFSKVFTEGHGTCSTKHALLQSIALENGFRGVELVCGIYQMNNLNTPPVAPVLAFHQLDYIPEAHCYLMQDGKRIDVTFPASDIRVLEPYIMEEIRILPEQVGQYKIDFHRAWMLEWIGRALPGWSLEEVWQVREACIAVL